MYNKHLPFLMFNITVEITFGRVFDKGTMKGKSGNLMLTSDGMHIKGEKKPKQGDKVLKRNIHFIEGEKYMSCIKVRHSPLFLSNTELTGRNSIVAVIDIPLVVVIIEG